MQARIGIFKHGLNFNIYLILGDCLKTISDLVVHGFYRHNLIDIQPICMTICIECDAFKFLLILL